MNFVFVKVVDSVVIDLLAFLFFLRVEHRMIEKKATTTTKTSAAINKSQFANDDFSAYDKEIISKN